MGTNQSERVKYALILGSSSGFGAATAVRLARDGFHIFGVHLDRKATMPKVEAVMDQIRSQGVGAVFFNVNAADDEKRQMVVAEIKKQLPAGAYIDVMLHSLAFGALKPFIADAPNQAINKASMVMTMDVMAHSLVYWTQELYWAGLLGRGSRIFAMTSSGSKVVFPHYGAVSAAKAALENHVKQLGMELGHLGVTVNAIMAGVTDTPALRKIPGHEKMIEMARQRNAGGRLTTPEDVANVISLLVRPEAQWINGGVIPVDGGELVMDKGEV